MSVLKKVDALRLLEVNNVPDNVLEHCLSVSALATKIAHRIKNNGHEVDTEFVETAGLLHDIGRARTHGIRHGVEGAAMLKDYPEYARVCERHIGGGIGRDEAERLGLPPKDYFPETLEEKIICYADKLMHGTEENALDETLKKFAKRLGADHPSIGRIRELAREMRSLMGE